MPKDAVSSQNYHQRAVIADMFQLSSGDVRIPRLGIYVDRVLDPWRNRQKEKRFFSYKNMNSAFVSPEIANEWLRE